MWTISRKLRVRAIIATAVILAIVIGLTIYHQSCGLPEQAIDYILFASQVVSGNWFPDPKGISGWPFVIGSAIAVILNILTVTGLIVAAVNFYFLKRSSDMDKMTAFDLRSADQKDRLLELLDEKMVEQLGPVIDRAFAEGDKTWKEKTLPSVLGEQAARNFLNTVEKTTPDKPESGHNTPHSSPGAPKVG